MGTEIRLATPADREPLVATVVEAFRGDPAFGWFFGDEYDRDGAIFAGALFDSRVGQEGVWTTEEIDAVALWDLPGTHAVSDFSALPAAARERLDRYHDATEAMLPAGDMWYLGILASHPSRRGSGLASAVAEVGLRAAAAGGLPAVLETTNRGNVAMYERRGWSVSGSTTLDELTIWVMTHPGVVTHDFTEGERSAFSAFVRRLLQLGPGYASVPLELQGDGDLQSVQPELVELVADEMAYIGDEPGAGVSLLEEAVESEYVDGLSLIYVFADSALTSLCWREGGYEAAQSLPPRLLQIWRDSGFDATR